MPSSGPGEKKRMALVETLVLGPTQRLILVRVGEEERLLELQMPHRVTAGAKDLRRRGQRHFREARGRHDDW